MKKNNFIIGGVEIAAILITIFFSTCHEVSTVPDYPQGPKVIIDHDGGADDAMAVFMALLYEKYFNGPQVIGLTTVRGNVNESQVFENSQIILDVANRRDIPIYRGSRKALVMDKESDYFYGTDGLGEIEHVYEPKSAEKLQAAVALIELAKKYPDELTVIAIGPLTNIALAARLDPYFIHRLSQVYLGAGNIGENQVVPTFNAMLDAEAYHILVDSAMPDKVTVMPSLQVNRYLNISLEWRLEILGAIPTKIMKEQNGFERLSLTASQWYAVDAVVAAAALDKNVVKEYRNTENRIILSDQHRGITTNNFNSATPNTRLAYSYYLNYYKDLLLRIFSAQLQ